MFGARPILGRGFEPEDDQSGADHVVVPSYSSWQNLFGGQRAAVGKTLILDGKPYRAIGVMRSDFGWPRSSDLRAPLALTPASYAAGERFNEFYDGVVRLRPGVNVEQLNAALALKNAEEMRREGSDGFAMKDGWSMFAEPWVKDAAGDLGRDWKIANQHIEFADKTMLLAVIQELQIGPLNLGTAHVSQLAFRHLQTREPFIAFNALCSDARRLSLLPQHWLDLSNVEVRQNLARSHSFTLAKLNYCPHRISIPVHLFLAQERKEAEPFLGWKESSSGQQIHAVPVGGNHLSIVRSPHVNALGYILSDLIHMVAKGTR